MTLRHSETEIIFRLFYERHKHVFLVLVILIVLLAAFTFFQIREMDKKTIATMESDKLKTKKWLSYFSILCDSSRIVATSTAPKTSMIELR